MAPPSSTVTWFVCQLRKMNWGDRHEHLKKIELHKPGLHRNVCELLGPDEALPGMASGSIITRQSVIVAKDRVGGGMKQMTLHRYLKKKQ